jgi:hypothetical protein
VKVKPKRARSVRSAASEKGAVAVIRIDDSKIVRWSGGSCDNADDSFVCAVCGLPIGVSEDDPKWDGRDQVPMIIFRGEGEDVEHATFHHGCFEQISIVMACYLGAARTEFTKQLLHRTRVSTSNSSREVDVLEKGAAK